MKKILISIKPEWVARILNGEKTLEIRNTAPKCELPIEVYIYCSKGGGCITSGYTPSGKTYPYFPKGHSMFSGKVVAKFTLKKCELITVEGPWFDCFFQTETLTDDDLLRGACLMGLEGYLKGCEGYAWHISDLEIFDEPKELSEFKQSKLPNPKKIKFANWKANYYWALGDYCTKHPQMMVGEIKRTFDESISIKRAPQSWCYVYVEENK